MFPWGSFPFSKDMSPMMKNMKPEMIDQYIRDAIASIVPAGTENSLGMAAPPSGSQAENTAGQVSASVFETHDYVFVRIKIQDEWMDRVRLYHTSNQLILENIPEPGKKETLNLPATVKKKGAEASERDGILEIKMLRAFDVQLSEINVS